MSIVINTALGSWNGGPEATNGHMPGHMYVDFVRVWQRRDRRNVGCDPPDHPTKEFIDSNSHLYGVPARPRGYDSCPQHYPPSTRAGAGGAAAGAGGAHGEAGGRRKPSGTWLLGFIALSLAGLALLMGIFGALSARAKGGQRGAPGASQYGEVGEAGASREPMLR